MIFTIAGKELKALFASPLAWLVLTVVQLDRRLTRSCAGSTTSSQVQPQLIQMASPPGATELVAAPALRDGRRGVPVRGAAARDAADRRGAAQPDAWCCSCRRRCP